MLVLQNSLLREWKEKLQTGRVFANCISTKAFYLKYIKISENSVIKKQFNLKMVKRTKYTLPQRKKEQKAIGVWRDTQHHLSLWKYKLKPQRDTPLHIFRMAKKLSTKCWQRYRVTRSHYIPSRSTKWYRDFGIHYSRVFSFSFCYEFKPTLMKWPNNSLSGYL